MKTCFIVCPIGNDGSDVRKRSDTLFKHVIAPVCQECAFEPIRIDKENTNGSLTDEIITHIKTDDLVIADITDLNPNAFYEIGYRAALKKPAIHLMSKNTDIPFDVSSIRTFMYDLSDLDSVEEVKNRLVQTIQSIDFSAGELSINTELPSVNTFNAQVLQEIYKVQDSINKLTTSIESNNSTALSVLADKLANANAKTPETIMLESMLPLLLDHPDKFQRLIELSKQIPPKKIASLAFAKSVFKNGIIASMFMPGETFSKDISTESVSPLFSKLSVFLIVLVDFSIVFPTSLCLL